MTQTEPGQAREASSRRSLQGTALRGTFVEGGGYAATQLLRLASNLVLSRLLFPEAFGLTAIVSIFLMGLELLSDVGLEPAVVQNARGDDPHFLDTVWVIKAVRGVALWLLACALAWPAAALYDEPLLLALLPVSGLSSLLHGVASTSTFTLRRHLRLLPLALLDVASKSVGVLVMIVWAWWVPTVWALVAGGLAEAAVHAAGTWRLPVGYRNRPRWDRDASRAVGHFGKWIFASSAVYFFGRQGDRLLLGKLLGLAALGVYSIAVFLSEALGMLIERVTHGVLYPLFSREAREGQARLRRTYYAVRLRMDLVALPAAGGLAALGTTVVDVLYDPRYADAGWMLELLCIRVAMAGTLAPLETCLFSLGQTRYAFYRNVARTLWIWAGIPTGFALGGVEGLVLATALSEIPVLLVLWPAFHAYGMLRVSREALAPLAFAAGYGAGTLAERLLVPSLRALVG